MSKATVLITDDINDTQTCSEDNLLEFQRHKYKRTKCLCIPLHKMSLFYKIIIILILLTLISLAISLPIVLSTKNSKSNDNICLTDDCIDLSNTLNNWMNFEANPCDDFYDYVCGNFKNNYIPKLLETSTPYYSALSKIPVEKQLETFTKGMFYVIMSIACDL